MFLRVFRFQPRSDRGKSPEIPIALALLMLAGCLHPDSRESGARIYVGETPSSVERYCAWYGDARDGVLYFGTSAFWSAMRSPNRNWPRPRKRARRTSSRSRPLRDCRPSRRAS